MENNLIIENLYASYEGALNPGLIERNELRKNDGFCYFLKGSLTYYFKGLTLSVKEGDVIELGFSSGTITVKVLLIKETVKKEDAEKMYQVIYEGLPYIYI